MSEVTGTSISQNRYLQGLQDQLEEEIDEAREKSDAEKSRHDQKTRELKRKLEADFQKAGDRMRDEYQSAAIREKDNNRAELARLKSEIYAPQRKATSSGNRERQELKETLEKQEKQLAARQKSVDSDAAQKIEKAYAAARDKGSRDAETLRDAHAQEVSRLLAELEYAQDEFARDLALRKESDDRRSEGSSRKNSEKIEELTRRNAQAMRELHTEHVKEERRLESAYNQDRNRLETARSEEREQFLNKVEDQNRSLTDQFIKTEGDRTRAHQETLALNKKTAQTEIRSLQDEVQTLKTSADPSKMSPDAQNTLRERMEHDFDLRSQARESQYDDKFTQLMEKGRSDYRQLYFESQREKAKSSQQLAQTETQGRIALTRQVQESEFDKDQAIRSKDDQSLRITQNLHKSYAQQLEDQRRVFEENLESLRNDALAKTQSLRQEADFQLRMERRAFAAQQNELIREYEKRLSDQKQEFTEELRATKAQTAKTLQDQERKHHQELEEQSQLHSRGTAQLEQQHQERERVSSKAHQDQIEKLKRTHALLLAKKS